MKRNDIRNVAVIAHVDHGKTTLVDQMLRQSGLFRSEELDKLVGGQHGLIMDSNDQERERGITILAKNCGIRIGDVKVNLVDTPGHADFGGEVERILKMADGAFVLVDSAEGPLPQTRFVLKKAFAAGLKPIVIINKIDRPDARITDVHALMFDLFIELGADDDTASFPIIYASGRAGIATTDMNVEPKDLSPLFDAILNNVPAPDVDQEAPLQMQVMALQYDEFKGKIAIGRVFAGKIRKNQKVSVVKQKDGTVFPDTIVQVLEFDRLAKREVEEVRAGDICAVVGIDDADIGDTICEFDKPKALPPLTIDEPTLDMVFRVNDSPFASRDGKPLTSRELRDRLEKELQHNVALRVAPGERESEFIVSGRGLLHLGVLLETMRREGSEVAVGKPRVIMKEIDGQKMEPYEHLVVEVPAEHQNSIMRLVLERSGEFQRMETHGNTMQVEFHIPARSLIGLRTRMLTATQGTAIMHHNFLDYRPAKGAAPGRATGVYLSKNTAKITAYAVDGLSGTLFVSPGDEVYEGQIVGEHGRDNDLVVNVTEMKPLTNMRASGSDAKASIKPAVNFSMEMALEYIEDDELVEITPAGIRMRKILLKEGDRKRSGRQNK
ncbi:GTP-binding protein TypA/BipA [Gemmata obscuriglobus]|uniref:50S ribosomal subunit assembly factor BipA n=1 Tax=Gemmata obscuriglobus TaxID=114 RepID=A0A2Z3H6V3_9BACT|nr:translational GTPase TypA [Gemmata obscuriglobus]AWM39316.1 translational GTPase TypA [Gemmata obscuriglobus]QEG27621.1 GTP-binding protein TypA/BipA [Gemmata obscuriglobus]VTS04765.1 gtp-binding protein : GTP-binding protein TypA/BipA OS=Singulisphaera acidiphila (strain ATCC BAA-1392 / DSM 18658 / VKM B-2454 / MOB10) GN=Sinac_5699 PE=4 SV=1: GTP_EFTU: GTP_EFTU_D2: EFG_C [Gemmata obscuriglobus UQM 2246]